MGIYGLWPLLEPTGTAITLDLLEGKRLAIDISFWLHQAAQGYANVGDGPDAKYPHLTLLIRRIAKLLFYKIRPVFVFDGPDVPVFKRNVLRDRALKRHLDDILITDRNQKRILEQIAHIDRGSSSLEDVGQRLVDAIVSPKKRARRSAGNDEEDMFALPSTSIAGRLTTDKMECHDFDYMAGYETLRSSDARVSFLQDAKERCRLARLRDDEIPTDSRDFSDFQLRRLVNRNRINTQLDVLRRDRLRQCVQLSDNNTKMVVVDNQLRSHVLLHNEDVQAINPEREARERQLRDSISWPEFLRRAEEETKLGKLTATGNKLDRDDEDDDDDDALQEAIAQSLAESQGLTAGGFRRLPEAGVRIAPQMDEWNSSEDEEANRSKKIVPIVLEEDDPSQKSVNYMSDHSSSTSSLSNDEVEEEAIVDLVDEAGDRSPTKDYFRPATGGAPAIGEPQDERSVYAECQSLLSRLGVPFLCAPGEAEAQCVELERLGLVDGVVSDDSDVWLFGARRVYKNMFSHAKHVQKYGAERILDYLGLSRNEFIQIGMLSGGDYSKGFQKIGVVAALELISEFLSTSDDGANACQLLERIGGWLKWRPAQLTGSWERIDRRDKTFVESKSRIRLRKIIESNNETSFIAAFPNRDVFNAYATPNVDTSDQRFTWERVDFDALNDFVWTKIGWRPEKLRETTHGAFEKWDEFVRQTKRQYQSRMDTFVHRPGVILGSGDPRMAPTFRVQMALAKLKGVKDRTETMNNNEDEIEDEEEMNLRIAQASTSSSVPGKVSSSGRKPKGQTTKKARITSSSASRRAAISATKTKITNTRRK